MEETDRLKAICQEKFETLKELIEKTKDDERLEDKEKKLNEKIISNFPHIIEKVNTYYSAECLSQPEEKLDDVISTLCDENLSSTEKGFGKYLIERVEANLRMRIAYLEPINERNLKTQLPEQMDQRIAELTSLLEATNESK